MYVLFQCYNINKLISILDYINPGKKGSSSKGMFIKTKYNSKKCNK